MQAVSLSYCFGLSESNRSFKVPGFQTIRKSAQTTFDMSVYSSPVETDRSHTMVRNMSRLSAQAEPTLFHCFLDGLARNGCLLRHYTQNINCIELRLPNLWQKTVQLHGRIDKAKCHFCGWDGPLVFEWFCGSDLPDCNRCEGIALERERMGKRRLGIGRLRPNVLLYGEDNPKGDMIGELTEQDLRTGPEVVFVVGTSLKVPGARRLVTKLSHAAKARGGFTVWINTDATPSGLKLPFDFAFQGYYDEVASLLSC